MCDDDGRRVGIRGDKRENVSCRRIIMFLKKMLLFITNTREKRSESRERDFPLSPNTLGPLCRNILPPYPPFITPRSKKN